jgi:hypothetical protein
LLNEAHAVLADSEKRKRYDVAVARVLASGEFTKEQAYDAASQHLNQPELSIEHIMLSMRELRAQHNPGSPRPEARRPQPEQHQQTETRPQTGANRTRRQQRKEGARENPYAADGLFFEDLSNLVAIANSPFGFFATMTVGFRPIPLFANNRQVGVMFGIVLEMSPPAFELLFVGMALAAAVHQHYQAQQHPSVHAHANRQNNLFAATPTPSANKQRQQRRVTAEEIAGSNKPKHGDGRRVEHQEQQRAIVPRGFRSVS